jgi:hypothetical protein
VSSRPWPGKRGPKVPVAESESAAAARGRAEQISADIRGEEEKPDAEAEQPKAKPAKKVPARPVVELPQLPEDKFELPAVVLKKEVAVAEEELKQKVHQVTGGGIKGRGLRPRGGRLRGQQSTHFPRGNPQKHAIHWRTR